MGRPNVLTKGSGQVGRLVIGRQYPVLFFTTSGAPTDGTSGTGANEPGNGKGSLLIDVATGDWYKNTNTGASPSWTPMGAGGAGEVLEVRNESGGTLTEGTLVYLSGWSETHSRFLVVKADADAAGGAAEYIVRAAILNNANGIAVKTHRLTAQATNGTTVGDPVYLHTTAGGYVAAAPTGADDQIQIVGRVAVVHASAGVVELNVRNPIKIGTNELVDLSVTRGKLAADVIDGTKLADDAVDSEHIAAGAIDPEHFAALSVETAAINNLAVTAGKLAAAVTSMINGLRTYLADGMLAIGTLTISAAAEKFKTTTSAIYTIAGLAYTKAATDNLVFSAADTINTGAAAGTLWGIWLVQIDAAGAISTKPGAADMTYANEAAAIAALPAVDASNVQLGYITVQALEATDWVANTDNLTVGGGAGNCTARSFYDLPAAKSLPAAL